MIIQIKKWDHPEVAVPSLASNNNPDFHPKEKYALIAKSQSNLEHSNGNSIRRHILSHDDSTLTKDFEFDKHNKDESMKDESAVQGILFTISDICLDTSYHSIIIDNLYKSFHNKPEIQFINKKYVDKSTGVKAYVC